MSAFLDAHDVMLTAIFSFILSQAVHDRWPGANAAGKMYRGWGVPEIQTFVSKW